MSQENKIISCLIISTVLSFGCRAQDTISFFLDNRDKLVDIDENIVHNATSLSPFFEKLYLLKHQNVNKVNIIQIGDSHIQADFLSGTIRQNFNNDFGNGGRGLIFPWRLARTNEAYGVTTATNAQWDVNRIINPDPMTPIGIAGASLKTTDKEATLSIKTTNFNSLNYGFDRLTLFYLKENKSFNFSVKDSLNEDVAFIGPFTLEQPNTSKVVLPFRTNQITLKVLQTTPAQTQALVFGVNLENGNRGVIFHSVGVNSAKYKHYLTAQYFSEQTAAISPDLFIISLGTNEALEYPYMDSHFNEHIDSLLSRLQTINPSARFLLTTPADSYKRKTKRNPGVDAIRKKIIAYANEKNIAYFDLYQAGGGNHSADHWRKKNFLRSDGIHFSVEGYKLQGNMLYDAIIKAYNDYVIYRHP